MRDLKLTVTSILFAVVLFFSAGNVQSDESYTGELPPVEIGSVCQSSPGAYYWVTRTKSLWKVKTLIAVPETLSPDEWIGKEPFVSSFQQIVGDSEDTATIVDALMTVWSEGTATVYGEFQRSALVQNRDVACLDGVWKITSDSTLTEPESSEWIGLLETPLARDGADTAALVQAVIGKLEKANQQSVTDLLPHHFYSETSD